MTSIPGCCPKLCVWQLWLQLLAERVSCAPAKQKVEDPAMALMRREGG